jgi:hypothetical protein
MATRLGNISHLVVWTHGLRRSSPVPRPSRQKGLDQEGFWLQLTAETDTIQAVHLQDLHTGSADGGEPDNASPLDPEVVAPDIRARIEEACQDAGGGVKARHIGSLVAIREMTGERQVAVRITPPMLPRDNMLDVKRDEIMLLVDLTIFAAVPRTSAHAGGRRGIHLRRRRLPEEGPRLLLEHGDHIHRVDVGLILGHFLGGDGALITLLGQERDARVHGGVHTQGHNPLGHFWREAGSNRIEDLGETDHCIVHRMCHARLLLSSPLATVAHLTRSRQSRSCRSTGRNMCGQRLAQKKGFVTAKLRSANA